MAFYLLSENTHTSRSGNFPVARGRVFSEGEDDMRTQAAVMAAYLAGCRPASEATIEAECEPTDNALRLSCTVTVDPPQAVSLSYGPEDGATSSRAVDSEAETATHTVEISMLRPETDYRFVASAQDGSVEREGSFRTGAPPAAVRSWLSVTGESSAPLIGTHAPCAPTAYAVIYDTATGELVWYELLDPEGELGPMDMLQFTEDHTVLGETRGKIVEVDLSGQVLLELVQGQDFDRELHHDLFKRDGVIYALSMPAAEGPEPGGEPLLDGFYVFDAATGSLLAEWDAAASLPIPDDAEGDWMHTNTLWVDPAGDIYLSLLGQSSVLKLAGDWTSPEFGTPLWALAGAEPAGLGNDYTIDWGPVAPAGFQDQHAASRLEDGTLLLLDNAHGRALALDVDEEARVATARAVYPTDEDRCGPQGTAAVTSEGNVLAGCLTGRLQEYTPEGSVAWSASFRGCADRPVAARFYPLEGW
jgi:hypothetical protein